MQRSYLLAASAAFALMLPTPIALAQGTDGTAQPPAATTSQATAPAPAATTTPSTDTKKITEKKPAKKKQMTRRQEIEHSIDTGTVPSRYRSSVPKEYQRYIPFDKK
ncbi:hypothetical protein QA640_06280 [Bradyrhizobium sp. CB82]|uniref:hypothetical protein n=1 Tax=Bradyrhizobium sp. CB82 TaxID=3039159 RepID=UPI0024B0B0D9|nr:hypothetical protein [Bradyrhizobium sp. CB82]WFU42097.1 hypothetical protein QA640_06280 [Bradyrhizobium sp. CB82]